MTRACYNPGHKAALDGLLLRLPGVRSGHMFGYPAYYAGSRLFACIYKNGVGFKLPADQAEKLVADGRALPFQPHGKARMREWVEIRHEKSTDYQRDKTLLRASARWVGSTASLKPRRT